MTKNFKEKNTITFLINAIIKKKFKIVDFIKVSKFIQFIHQ
jgi:hypothetical protein